ncbi:MAG: efflux RND transporter permease subunit [Pseudomonadota bacterium]|nr:efflux RND transporter permease subunit [Pseudomonadota bacterium]QKK04513.1 MAG: efflux RND transporter permease subunit [Pseudomonadota bacterium]
MSANKTDHPDEIENGPIKWMAAHPVAANLLMVICLLGGLFIFTQSTQEVFPEFALDTVTVRMSYPGASPEEVEQGIVLAVEDAVRDIEGLGEITSRATEGAASVSVEVLDTENMMRVLQDVQSAVDRVTTFPVDAENLTVAINSRRRDVVTLALFGDADERVLRNAAEQVQAVLEQDPDIGPVELGGVRDYEIHIEVSQDNLRRYNLSLPQIAQRVRQTALELGGGALDTTSGEILVRMTERRDTAKQFRDVPVIIQPNGSQVLLGDIAHIREAFADSNNYAVYNGHQAVFLDVYRIGDQTPVGVSSRVKAHIATLNETLPPGIDIIVLDDRSKIFQQRAALLVKNGLWGLGLVVLLLTFFLETRLAFWVSMGIPIAFMGAFLTFPATDFTVNIVSMFAFIIALGLVVDDAIVSGENIYSYRQKGMSPLMAAVTGAREIAYPVTVSVLTNIVAFLPLFFMPGTIGKIFSVIPVVVCAVFLFSLIECLFVLPAHLAFTRSKKEPGKVMKFLGTPKRKFQRGFQYFVKRYFRRFIGMTVRHRYFVVALFMAFLAGVGGYVGSGRMGMEMFPRVESDYAFASVTLPVGTPMERVMTVQKHMLDAAKKVVEENGGDRLATGVYGKIAENVIEARIYLTDPDIRPVSTRETVALWRDEVGVITGLESSSFLSNRGGPGSGAALTVELSHTDTAVLDAAAQRLAVALADFPNTKDIDDGSAQGKKQFNFRMTTLGYTLGMTTENVARQVRAAFYGSEVFKQQRGRDEVRILVRLPEAQRSSQYDLYNLMLRAPDGSDVMLRDVVTMEEGRAYTSIYRRDGRRVVQVAADVDPPSQAGRIINVITQDALPELQRRYPGLTYSFEGRQAEIRDSIMSLLWGLFAVLFVIYALLALQFGSYSQPLMVLLAIPFGAIGAVFGHMIMGYSLSVMSLLGMMALSGVVVNGSLILVDFANRRRAKGMTIKSAITDASVLRFRPILLTTLTTFIGLAPMIFETSRQARFLIPMAISLGFGILFAALITLVLIPAFYVIIVDIRGFFGARKARKEQRSEKPQGQTGQEQSEGGAG